MGEFTEPQKSFSVDGVKYTLCNSTESQYSFITVFDLDAGKYYWVCRYSNFERAHTEYNKIKGVFSYV